MCRKKQYFVDKRSYFREKSQFSKSENVDMKVRTSASNLHPKIMYYCHHKKDRCQQFDITPIFEHLKWPPVGHLRFFENTDFWDFELDQCLNFPQNFRAIPVLTMKI